MGKHILHAWWDGMQTKEYEGLSLARGPSKGLELIRF